MAITTNDKNLGHATAYAYAKSKGYTGTEEEFAELMASYATVAESAEESRQAAEVAQGKAEDAQAAAETAQGVAEQAKDTAVGAKDTAVSAATTATTKAGEASASATSALDSATAAAGSATSAGNSALAASGSAATATTKAGEASDSATAAATAQEAAENAQTAAEQAAASVSASAAQITTNTKDISELKSDLTSLLLDEEYKTLPFEVTDGYYIKYRDGTTGTNATLGITNYVDVSNYVALKYKRRGTTASNNTSGLAFYNAQKVYISGESAVSASTSGYLEELAEIAVPENAKYARFTTFADTVTYGSFELYGQSKLINKITQMDDVLGNPYPVLDITFEIGKSTNSSGAVIDAPNSSLSSRILANQAIYRRGSLTDGEGTALNCNVSQYNANGVFISKTALNVLDTQFIFDPECASFRLSVGFPSASGKTMSQAILDQYVAFYTDIITVCDNVAFLKSFHPQEKKNYVAIGASTTVGHDGADHATPTPYPYWVGYMGNFNVINLAVGSTDFVSRGSSGNLQNYMDVITDPNNAEALSKADLISVWVGINDKDRNVETGTYTDYYAYTGTETASELYSNCTKAGAMNFLIKYLSDNYPNAQIVFVIGPRSPRFYDSYSISDGTITYVPSSNQYSQEVAELAKQVCEATNVPIADSSDCYGTVFNVSGLFTSSSNKHPTMAGYNRYSKAIASAIVAKYRN